MKLSLIPLAALLVAAAPQQSKVTRLQLGNIKGQVQQFSEATYMPKEVNGQAEPGEQMPFRSRHFFDQQGNMTRTEMLNGEGQVESVIHLKYLDKGQREESESVMRGELQSRTVTTLEKGRVKEAITYSPQGEQQYSIRYTYSKGLSGTYASYKQGQLQMQTVRTYDGHLLLEEKTTDPSGNVVMHTRNTRDSRGDIVEQMQQGLNSPEPVTYRFRYQYDPQQNWIRQDRIGPDGKVDQIVLREFSYYSGSRR